MGTLIVIVCSLGIIGIIRLGVWVRKNPQDMLGPDEPDITEAEWQNAIR